MRQGNKMKEHQLALHPQLTPLGRMWASICIHRKRSIRVRIRSNGGSVMMKHPSRASGSKIHVGGPLVGIDGEVGGVAIVRRAGGGGESP